MFKSILQITDKMVKNKRDLKSPRRNRSFTGSRPLVRSRQTNTINGGNIRVIVRVRPSNQREDGNNLRNVIKVIDDHTLVFDPKEEDEPFFYHGVQQRNRDIMKRANKDLHFTFDRVFGFDANNGTVFENSTKTLIETLMKGYNCSVFVYGATGAGKTHTMLGCEDDPGITFLTMRELFQQKDELSHERDFEIRMTYLEVYNETVQDLLNPGPALNLREDGKYGVIVAGIQVHRIDEPEKLFALLEQGNHNRTQHPTDANAESSRSHAVFQVYIRMKFKTSAEVRVAKLSMIDLAGSERGAATGYSGARFAEGANINKSLLALGNCINSLADGHRHIPYRDSKLTRLLKDSLGGNCQTIMVANVSPSSLTYEDTYNTLKYAMRAKKIKSNMKKNVINSDINLNHYIKLVDELTKENAELKLQLSMSSKACSCGETAEKDDGNINLQTELKTLYTDKRELEQRVAQLESTKQIMTLRKHLKEEANARLSGICSNTPEKQEGHIRLGNAVDRLERQAANIQQEILNLRKRNEHIEMRLREFLQKAPHLQSYAEKEDALITYAKANNKSEHLQKVCDLQAGQLRIRDQLIESFSEVLQPCFLQLRGHGLATETLTASYRGLVRHLQGIRSVTWDDDITSDSGVSSSTNIIEEQASQGIKHHSSEDITLDRTFVLPSSKPLTQCTDKLIGTSTSDENLHIPNSTAILSEGCSNSMEQFVDAAYYSTHPEIPTQNEFKNVCAEELMLKVYNQSPLEKPNQYEFKNVCAEELMVKVYTPSPEKNQDVPVLDRTRVLSKQQSIISASHLTGVSNPTILQKPSQNVKVYAPSPRKKQKVSVLDRTRVLSCNKQSTTSTSLLSAKVYKSPKALKRNGVSPTNSKENKNLVRTRPLHGTSNSRIGSGQDKTKNSNITSTLKPSTITRAFSPRNQK